MAVILGADPGLAGALCFMNSNESVWQINDMPTLSLSRGGKNKREIDAHALVRMLSVPIGHAFLEQVGAMPGQGVSGMFAFGKAYGILIGVLAARGVPMTFVAPKVWKKAFGVQASKDAARARASQLIPDAAHNWPLVKHSDRAEAAMIALWGVRSLNAIFGQTAAELMTQPVRERADSSAPSVDRP